MPTFLSDEWFSRVLELKNELSPIDVPAPYQGLTINLHIAQADGSTKAATVSEGAFTPGALDGATVDVSLPIDLGKKIFVEGDTHAGTAAFMNGQMKIEGDIARLVAVQGAKPGDLQRLIDGIRSVTD